jgi:hypothetical protein
LLAWSRKEHHFWSITTEVEQWGDKSVVMKAIIKDNFGNMIASARKTETEAGFPDYIEKAETGAVAEH